MSEKPDCGSFLFLYWKDTSSTWIQALVRKWSSIILWWMKRKIYNYRLWNVDHFRKSNSTPGQWLVCKTHGFCALQSDGKISESWFYSNCRLRCGCYAHLLYVTNWLKHWRRGMSFCSISRTKQYFPWLHTVKKMLKISDIWPILKQIRKKGGYFTN